MSSKDKEKPSRSKDDLPSISAKAPVTPVALPATSKDPRSDVIDAKPAELPRTPWKTKCWKYIYNREQNLFCERTCKSWWYMIIYSIMYIIFLSTYTMVFLYVSLTIIKMRDVYNVADKSELMAYADNGIGLTATPTTMHSSPLITFTHGRSEDYNKYVKSLDELLVKRRKRQITNSTDLGPCGTSPYGYGNEPCVIIRLNKQLRWSAKPLRANSTQNLPKELKDWLKLKEQKLWLYCDGYHSYDKEHIGRIKYYPYPPGFDPGIFPLDMKSETPLIAIQIIDFTIGLSLAIECKLWYDGGVSSVAFLLYVQPKSRPDRNAKSVVNM